MVSAQVILVDRRQLKFEANELQVSPIFHLFLYLLWGLVPGYLNRYSKDSHSLNVAKCKL